MELGCSTRAPNFRWLAILHQIWKCFAVTSNFALSLCSGSFLNLNPPHLGGGWLVGGYETLSVLYVSFVVNIQYSMFKHPKLKRCHPLPPRARNPLHHCKNANCWMTPEKKSTCSSFWCANNSPEQWFARIHKRVFFQRALPRVFCKSPVKNCSLQLSPKKEICHVT